MMPVVPQDKMTRPKQSPAWSLPALLVSGFIAVVIAVILAWGLLGWLLATDRGIDLTDEGLYLLAADPPNASAAWGFPFGWHVRPLFQIVNYDITAFRTLGAVILVVCFAWLGFAAARIGILSSQVGRSSVIFLSLGTMSGALGALLFYAPMLRTPSYNWINLVGITVAVASVFTLAMRLKKAPRGARTWPIQVSLVALASLALFATIPAKPSTFPLLLLLTTLFLLVACGARSGVIWALATIAFIPMWVGMAFLLEVWPSSAAEVFRLAVAMPSPDPRQTTSSAVLAALLLPMDFALGLMEAPVPILLFTFLGIAMASVPPLAGRSWPVLRILGFALAAIGALALAGVPIPGLRVSFEEFRIANANVTTACLIVLMASLLGALRRNQPVESPADVGGSDSMRWGAVGLLATLPFVFSFGSGNGIYAQASLAGGYLLLAGFILFPQLQNRRYTLGLITAMTVTVLSFSATAVVSGWQAPFRSTPLANQTSPTLIGVHGSQLNLDARLSSTLTDLRARAEAAGWTPGTPVIDVSFMWNPTIPYALGGVVPDYLVLTIFGYPAAHDIVDFHLTQPYLDFPYQEAWFVTSRPPSISDANGQSAVDFTLQKFVALTGRAFPDSYSCVIAGDFILWRPTATSSQEGQSCAS